MCGIPQLSDAQRMLAALGRSPTSDRCTRVVCRSEMCQSYADTCQSCSSSGLGSRLECGRRRSCAVSDEQSAAAMRCAAALCARQWYIRCLHGREKCALLCEQLSQLPDWIGLDLSPEVHQVICTHEKVVPCSVSSFFSFGIGLDPSPVYGIPWARPSSPPKVMS